MLKPEEEGTQGDPLVMPFYALATIPLIRELYEQSSARQVWFVDDSAAVGRIIEIRKWWDTLVHRGPAYGYFVNTKKTWLVMKESMESGARDLFSGTDISITIEGRPYLGSPMGSQSYMEEFVSSKVDSWTTSFKTLSQIALSYPRAAYAAFTHGFPACGCWYMYVGPHRTSTTF